MSKDFPLCDVISVTTSRYVSRNGLTALYDLLRYMVGEPVWTHQIPRVVAEVTPSILEQHPELVGVEVPDYDGYPAGQEDFYESWLQEQEAKHGESISLEPLSPEDHTSVDPVDELLMMGVPASKIGVVSPGEEGQ